MTSRRRLPRIAILGGGMAGLTTAWELSRGLWRDRYESITVYQRGWRLGGKGASSRGVNGRIEEHGLHVLLGYYQDTFRVMDECYRELDRPTLRPECPISSWDEAVTPTATVGLTESGRDGWYPWSMDFPMRRGVPGRREALGELDLAAAAVQSLRLLAAFYAAAGPGRVAPVTLSAHPDPPTEATAVDVLRGAGLTLLAGIVEVAGRGERFAAQVPALGPALEAALERIRTRLFEPLRATMVGEVTWTLVDMVMTNLIGIVRDRLLTRRDGAAAIDDLDYRDWLARHGAAPETRDNAIIRGMYDLVFAYREGDPARPAFSAGLGLQLATRMLLDYDGSLFWKMRAGMGEVVFAPLYEVLASRGVDFRFFHRIDELVVADGAVSEVHIGRQARLRDPAAGYQPLIEVGGLPAWPTAPLADQLDGAGEWLLGAESFHGERRDDGEVVLRAGEDYDLVVFAASLGIVPHVAGQLLAESARWRAMVEHVGTVPTQAFQIWMTEDEKALGWEGGSAVTLSGFAPPFDTWASMSHLLDVEQWPAEADVRSIAYFCGSMADGADTHAAVAERATQFLEDEVGALWPNALDEGGGFKWDILAAPDSDAGPQRFTAQYWRANADPSDRYVQSLPGTDRYRLSPADSGFANLVIAGDWTDCGLNAGCVEAATRSGIQAAVAIADRTGNNGEEVPRKL